MKPALLISGHGSSWASGDQRIRPCVWPGNGEEITEHNLLFCENVSAQLEWDLSSEVGPRIFTGKAKITS